MEVGFFTQAVKKRGIWTYEIHCTNCPQKFVGLATQKGFEAAYVQWEKHVCDLTEPS